MRGVFITGTGTGVGKTLVAAGVLRCLRANGIDAVPMKPVQTGSKKNSRGGLAATDLDFILSAAGLSPSAREKELMSPFRYEPACSPHLAGRLAGRCADLEGIESCARALMASHQALVVEGTGGLLAPIDERHTMRDLITRLGLPVVIVAHAGLGTINHTLLTIESLRAAKASILGIVYNDFAGDAEDEPAIRDDNPAAVEHFSGVPSLGSIPHLEAADFWETFDRATPGLQIVLSPFL